MGNMHATVRQVTATLLTLGIVGLAAPASAHTDEGGLLGALPLLQDSDGEDSERPSAPADPPRAADRVTPPAVLETPSFTVASTTVGGKRVPLVVPDAALPFRFSVDRRLADRLGERAVYDALRQWDGIPGSRWATVYGGLVDGGKNAADGQSVVFEQHDCPAGTAGYAYWQTASSQPDVRYGSGALYITEVDVAICSSVTTADALDQVLTHEVGHALGLDHLCDPGQPCWREGMGAGPHTCRLMYSGSGNCQRRFSSADHDSVIHLYPTLQRLSGPTRVETAARASYAAFAAGSAAQVVVADARGPAHGPLAAAALAGQIDAPFLLASPGADCLTGAAAEELARVAAERARVTLVGAWPATCSTTLARWGFEVERIDGRGPIALGLAIADRLADARDTGPAVVLVSDTADRHGHVPDGVAGGAAAAAAGGPILYTAGAGLDSTVSRWLARASGLRRVYVLGGEAALGPQVVDDVRALGLEPVRLAGPSRVETALAVAAREELFSPGGPVVVASSASWPDAVTGSGVGARSGAPVVVTPPGGHGRVERWLSVRPPQGGWIVGGSAALPYELQWRYARLVKP